MKNLNLFFKLNNYNAKNEKFNEKNLEFFKTIFPWGIWELRNNGNSEELHRGEISINLTGL